MRPLLPVCALLVACTASPASQAPPTLGEPELVVPGDALPEGLEPQDSNNNLDVVDHDGALFLAFRTAPTHFASASTELHLLRSDDDGASWTREATFAQGTDLREPRFLSWQGALHLYYAVLGDDPTDFEPQGTERSRRGADGSWSTPGPAFDGDFVPWRARAVGDRAEIVGYTGGSAVYDFDALPAIELRWLASHDGEDWSAAHGEDPVVRVGGGSEADIAHLADGRVVAVVRNEAGDAEGWGSDVCRGEASAPADWTCARDPKKYDSPLLFVQEDPDGRERVWLVGRRHLSETGNYDLSADGVDLSGLSHASATLENQVAYWNEAKRCSLWEVEPDALTVRFVLDLPSAGDTCFPSARRLDATTWELWNYSSAWWEDEDRTWLEGQLGETFIYRVALVFP
jgi:hypothetical protein